MKKRWKRRANPLLEFTRTFAFFVFVWALWYNLWVVVIVALVYAIFSPFAFPESKKQNNAIFKALQGEQIYLTNPRHKSQVFKNRGAGIIALLFLVYV